MSPFSARINPFPNKPCFSCVCSTSLLKTLWEKGNLSFLLLSTEIEIVVCKLFQFGGIQNLSCGKGLMSCLQTVEVCTSLTFCHLLTLSLNPFPNKPLFLRVCSKCLLKTMWEKEKLLVTSNFSFFHIVFYPSGKLSAIFIIFEIIVCELQVTISILMKMAESSLNG